MSELCVITIRPWDCCITDRYVYKTHDCAESGPLTGSRGYERAVCCNSQAVGLLHILIHDEYIMHTTVLRVDHWRVQGSRGELCYNSQAVGMLNPLIDDEYIRQSGPLAGSRGYERAVCCDSQAVGLLHLLIDDEYIMHTTVLKVDHWRVQESKSELCVITVGCGTCKSLLTLLIHDEYTRHTTVLKVDH